MSAIRDFDNIRFGGPTIPGQFTHEATATPSRILNNDPDRLAVYIANNNVGEVFMAQGPGVTSVAGMPIGNGIIFVLQVQNDGALCGVEWWVISPAGAQTLYVATLRRLNPGTR